MVMDIRHLRVAPEEEPLAAAAPGLDEWLSEAVESTDPQMQARCLMQLRLAVPSAEGLERLRQIVGDDAEPRRLLAAQMLGHHRPWLSTPAGVRRQLELARAETDAAVAAALVWGLRQCEEAAEFVAHADGRVAREAALSAPISRRTLSLLLEALRQRAHAEVERILLGKMRQMHPSLVRYVVDLLLGQSWGEESLRALFAALPQLPLFELLLEAERPLAKVMGDAEKARAWRRLARVAAEVLSQRPGGELLRHLLSRSGDDEAFARRHAPFLRRAVQGAAREAGAEVVGFVERLTFGASEDKVARLAQLLVELSGRLDGEAADKMSALLEEWKSRSADLKLRIYHLEQGIG